VAKKSDTEKKALFKIPRASAADLRGRQSVRTTFKLSNRCIEAIHILGMHLQLMPKSLFDHLVQERDTLEAIAKETQASVTTDEPRTSKTYVISRDAGEILNRVSRKWKIARDALLETSIRHLMPLIEKEQVRHTCRKQLIFKMKAHLVKGRQLLDEMVADLGENDPMCSGMKNVVANYEKEFEAIAGFIKKGESIEGFDIKA
jgi:hypothetical protein